jgi:hypothetical protein
MRARRSKASDRVDHHTHSYRAQNGRSHQPGTLLGGRFRRLTGDSIPYRYVRGRRIGLFKLSHACVRVHPDLLSPPCSSAAAATFLEPSNA